MPDKDSTILLHPCPACGGKAHPPLAQFTFVDCADCGFAGPGPIRGLSPGEAWNVVAEALAGDLPWIGDGPTEEEAGGESILFRLDTDLYRATLEWWTGKGYGWKWEGEKLCAESGFMPTGWRRMPKASHESLQTDSPTAAPKITFQDFDPDVTEPGRLCMLCDSSAGCSHPRRRCIRCGVIGLAENMTVERHQCTPEGLAFAEEARRRLAGHLGEFGAPGASSVVGGPLLEWALEIRDAWKS